MLLDRDYPDDDRSIYVVPMIVSAASGFIVGIFFATLYFAFSLPH